MFVLNNRFLWSLIFGSLLKKLGRGTDTLDYSATTSVTKKKSVKILTSPERHIVLIELECWRGETRERKKSKIRFLNFFWFFKNFGEKNWRKIVKIDKWNIFVFFHELQRKHFEAKTLFLWNNYCLIVDRLSDTFWQVKREDILTHFFGPKFHLTHLTYWLHLTCLSQVNRLRVDLTECFKWLD